MEHKVDILILGGGLAGLGAAYAISKASGNDKKYSYLVLEAQNRAGGRVMSHELLELPHNHNYFVQRKLGKKFVDAGAQWLHGRNNHLYTISEDNNLLTSYQSEEGLGQFFYENCDQLDPFLVKKVDFHIGQLLMECEEFVKKKTKKHPQSVGHFLRERFEKFLDDLENQQDRQRCKDLFGWHERFQIIDNSCLTLDQLSAKYWGKYSFNGESCQAHYNFKQGFATVIDCLISVLDNNSIRYNKNVVEINIHDSRTEANILVKCSDGSYYMADHVLVTFSLGVLKKNHKQLFHPPLPRSMQTAIDSIGFETINKIFMEFDTPWWHELDGIQFIFQNEDKKEKWTHYLTGFDILQPHNSNILLGWVGGIGAIQMETLTDDQIIEDCVHLLAKFTNMYVPYPRRRYCTRWKSNQFINGAYSYISTNCDDNETISQNLLSQTLTINDFFSLNSIEMSDFKRLTSDSPLVLFAGEACHEKYFSTAHGAFLSGMEQASVVLESKNKTHRQ